MFYIENNGVNPINVNSIDLVDASNLLPLNIFSEIENTLPMVVSGNSQVDIITDQYSLNINDITSDVTYLITFDIIDLSDFTTVIDSTASDLTFEFINNSVLDTTSHYLLSKLNKFFKIGPNGTDTTISASSFTSTGVPVLQFDSKLKYSIFHQRYNPQFAVFNNTSNQINVIVGAFYFNDNTKSVECYFTESERDSLLGLVFNNIFMFYSEV